MSKLRGFLFQFSYMFLYPFMIILLLFYTPVLRGDTVVFMTDAGQVPVFVEVADNPIKQQQGLMNRTELKKDSGMLFIFGDETMRHFWMKNTLIPLDMIFIDSDGEIVHIHKNVQPCKTTICDTYGSNKPAKYVVEVIGGYTDKKGIDIGDKVKIPSNI
ncbi:MAG: DUF192 domain-containing protein [Candidatus Aenigmatarchaeota archaeon]